MCVYVYIGAAIQPAAVGEGAAAAREEVEAAGRGGRFEARRDGGDATHTFTS